MINRENNKTLAALVLTGIAALGWSASALAIGGGHGGGGGGGHSGGGGHFSSGGHFSGGGHFAGGPGGYAGRGAYGGRGGYGGYRGSYGGYGGRAGYGYHGGYGGWGWGGLGLGLYFATLPFYYSTFWANGVPYYYADDNYYQWDSDVGEYQTVNPPAEVQRQAAVQSPNLITYPKNGQTAEQQATDKSQCSTWAAAQSGFDPTQEIAKTSATSESANKRSQYMRADAACLDGRGYSVK